MLIRNAARAYFEAYSETMVCFPDSQPPLSALCQRAGTQQCAINLLAWDPIKDGIAACELSLASIARFAVGVPDAWTELTTPKKDGARYLCSKKAGHHPIMTLRSALESRRVTRFVDENERA